MQVSQHLFIVLLPAAYVKQYCNTMMVLQKSLLILVYKLKEKNK